MTKEQQRKRKNELYEEALVHLKSRNADFVSYTETVNDLKKADNLDEKTAKAAHKKFIEGKFPGLAGKKLRFLAKQRAAIKFAEERRNGKIPL